MGWGGVGWGDRVEDVGGERPDALGVRRRVLAQLLPHPRHRLGRRRVHRHLAHPPREAAQYIYIYIYIYICVGDKVIK